MWAAQPVLALLTTCGTTTPRGLRAGTGADKSGDRAPAGKELVAPSEYPTDETLAEMVDPYEALVCWFYLPDEGNCDGGAGGGGDGGGGGTNEHGGVGGDGGGSRYGQGIACFVAYRDEGERRLNEDNADGGGRKKSKRLADLEAKRAAIAARARDRGAQGKGAGEGGHAGSQSSVSSGDDFGDSGSDAGGGAELDANDFEPGTLRVRVILASAGTTQQLRKATGAFLKTTRNRNPVSACRDSTCASLRYRTHVCGAVARMRVCRYCWGRDIARDRYASWFS